MNGGFIYFLLLPVNDNSDVESRLSLYLVAPDAGHIIGRSRFDDIFLIAVH